MCDSLLGNVLGSGTGGGSGTSAESSPHGKYVHMYHLLYTQMIRGSFLLHNFLILAKGMKAPSVTVNIGLVSKCQTHCCWKVLLWEMTKSREKSLDGDQD